MPAARRPISHQAAHTAGQRDALVGNLDAVSRLRVRVASGQQTIETVRRALKVIAGSGISLNLTDGGAGTEEAQLTITNTGGGGGGGASTTQVMAYRLFTAGVGASSTTALSTDYTIAVDATTTFATVNLPAASSVTGQIFAVKHLASSSNSVTIDASGAETIDGATTATLTPGAAMTLQSTGSAWVIL